MKSLILTLSAGRSGTNKLANLLSLVPGVYAEHEGDPGFHSVRLPNIIDSSIGIEFVKSKIEFFNSQPEEHIAHTGHMAGEGFFEHFIAQGVVPNIITLRRNPREVALSMFNLNWIPYRNKLLSQWYAGPNEVGTLPYTGWETAHGYQLCYWWCCDTERRIQMYTSILKQLGSKIWETTLPQILELNHFNSMLDFFSLPNIDYLPQEKINHIESYNLEFLPYEPPSLIYLNTLEQEVLENIPKDFKDHLVDMQWHKK